jgi:putative phosphoesterase
MSAFRIGLISDTHGLVRPEALAVLSGCAHIVHGGDVGDGDVLGQLGAIAPVTAVRGNNDHGPWGRGLRDTELVEAGGIFIYAVHDIAGLDIDPAAAGVQVVVSGHSHRPRVEERDGVWFVNPGSAGPRRFSLPVSVAEVVVENGRVTARGILLDIARKS